MARCTSAAATDESTPPDSPQITRDEPTSCSNLLDLALDERARRPTRLRVADAKEEVRDDLAAARRVRDFGVELHAMDRLLAVPHRGDRHAAARRGDHVARAAARRRGRRGSSTRSCSRSAESRRTGPAARRPAARRVRTRAGPRRSPRRRTAARRAACRSRSPASARCRRSPDRPSARPPRTPSSGPPLRMIPVGFQSRIHCADRVGG